MITDIQKMIIQNITSKYHPTLVGVFGSYARNSNHADSDLDILIDFPKPINFLDLIGLEQSLSDALGVKVDLITKKSLHQKIAPFVEQDLVRIV